VAGVVAQTCDVILGLEAADADEARKHERFDANYALLDLDSFVNFTSKAFLKCVRPALVTSKLEIVGGTGAVERVKETKTYEFVEQAGTPVEVDVGEGKTVPRVPVHVFVPASERPGSSSSSAQ